LASSGLFLVTFFAGLGFVLPGLFDTTMMSRLAVYPLLGTAVLFFGRRNTGLTHLITGGLLCILPCISLLWSQSPVGGIPFAVRWFSFGIMIAGFSGSVHEKGLKPHLRGLAAAGALTSLLLVIMGPDTLTGNPNRVGMVLALSLTASIACFERKKPLSWAPILVIPPGLIVTGFYTGWIAALAGAAVFLLAKKRASLNPVLFLLPMIACQAILTGLPGLAERVGPTVELRAGIWRQASALLLRDFPLGTGTGSARLEVFSSWDSDLRELAGVEKRVDYLHSEPLALATENGLAGMLLVLFLLYWFIRAGGSPVHAGMLAAFWPIFSTDLPIATPLGGLPAALLLGSLPCLWNRRITIPSAVPLLLTLPALFWAYLVMDGYRAFGGAPAVNDLERACRRIPWEERAFLGAGHLHLQQGMVLASLEDSRRFLELYPNYHGGWELRASALAAAGRNAGTAWARAALLMPDGLDDRARQLMALNGVDPEGMNPDTAMMLCSLITWSRNDMGVFTESIPGEGRLAIAEKLLYLSSVCENTSPELAARAWFTALAFAVLSEREVPSNIALGILSRMHLEESLPWDWPPKLREYLHALESGLGPGLHR
jgi:hypothetical protein